MTALAAVLVCAVIVAAALAITVVQFTRDVRKHGGVRELLAELIAAARPATPVPAAEPPQVPWYAPEVLHAPAGSHRRPRLWEPATPADTAGVPPWDPAAPSQGTGYTKWHAEHLRELLGRRPS